MDHSNFITYVNIRLQKIQNTPKREVKLVIVNELYEYIIENKWFLQKHFEFYKIIKNKLYDIKNSLDVAHNTIELYDIFDVDKYIEILDNYEKESDQNTGKIIITI